MKPNQITGVHVDNMNHDATNASAGYSLGDFRFHLWFNPVTMKHNGVLYKNRIVPLQPRERTTQANPDAKANQPFIAEMWRQIAAGDMIAEAIRIEAYEAVRHHAENENYRFDMRIKLRARAIEALQKIVVARDPHDCIEPDDIEAVVDAMEWAQGQ